MTGIILVDDVTRTFISSAPSGAKLAGYTTGSGGIMWDSAEWASHPDAIRIDQDMAASDQTADALDVESGAATFADCPVWARAALANFEAAKRPGQRRPAIYFSLSNLANVVNALTGAGITSGVGLWIADWMNSESAGQSMLGASHSGFPVIGVQFENAGLYDLDVFDETWWSTRSAVPPVPVPAPVPPTWPLTAGMSDTPGVTAIHNLQGSLNRWRSDMGDKFGPLLVDGIYGNDTASAVIVAQHYFGDYSEPPGVCDQTLYENLGKSPPVPAPAPAGLKQSVVSTGADVTFSWEALPGISEYLLQIEVNSGGAWNVILNAQVSGASCMQSLAPRRSYRWRVAAVSAARIWPAWAEFTTL
jgi:hypothetical protein